jgi:anti-anti-sigma factor
MNWVFDPPTCPGWHPWALDVSESSGTVIIRIRGSLDARTAREVHRSVVSQTARTEIEAVEIDLRGMDSWTSAGLLELGTCAGRRVRFRMGPNVATARR